MKKILILIISLFLCVNLNAQNNNILDEELDWPTLVFLNQFNVVDNAKNIRCENITIEIFQTLAKNAGLGDCNDKIVFYLTARDDDIIYDGRVIKDKTYLIGTYTYEYLFGYRTVKAYVNDYDVAVIFIKIVKQAKQQLEKIYN